MKRTPTWPVLLLCLPAFVAIWGGWVGLGEMTGFGEINMLPGMVPDGGWSTINTAVTLPIGLETYAAYALHAALNTSAPGALRTFATRSAIGALVLGGAGQLAFHILESQGVKSAPWWITAIVATIPVAVLGAGTALAALLRRENGGQLEKIEKQLAPAVEEVDVDAILAKWEIENHENPMPVSPAPFESTMTYAVPGVSRETADGKTERTSRAADPELRGRVQALVEQGFPFQVDNAAPGSSTMRKYAKVARALWNNQDAVIDYKAERVKEEIVESEIRPVMKRERVR